MSCTHLKICKYSKLYFFSSVGYLKNLNYTHGVVTLVTYLTLSGSQIGSRNVFLYNNNVEKIIYWIFFKRFFPNFAKKSHGLEVFTAFATKLEIGLRCILFSLIIFAMLLKLN